MVAEAPGALKVSRIGPLRGSGKSSGVSLGASRTSWEGSGQHRARVRNFRKRLERQLWTGSFLNALAWSAYARCPEITAPPCPTQWGPSGGPQCGHAPVASSCAYFVVLGAQLGLPAGTGRPLCGSPGPGRTRVQAIVPYHLPQDPLAGPSAVTPPVRGSLGQEP